MLIDYPRDGVALLTVEKGEPEGRLGRWSGAAFAVRSAVGTAEDGIHASFGPIGSANGSIELLGRGPEEHEGGSPRHCQRKPRYLDVRFSGVIALHVKGGLLRVNTAETKGYVYRRNELGCERQKSRRTPSASSEDLFSHLPHPAQGFFSRENPILFSSLHHRHRWIEMAASIEATTAGLASFRAEAMEWLPEDIAAVRWVEASRVSPAFLVFGTGDPPSSATLEPPGPFIGSARFNRQSHSLRGSLAVRLPGGLRVRLGSRSSRASVCDQNLHRNACR